MTLRVPTRAELEAFRATLPERERNDCFRFGRYSWDVVKARCLVDLVPHPVRQIDITGAAKNYGYDRLVNFYRYHPHLIPAEAKPSLLEVRAMPFVLVGVEMQTVVHGEVDLSRPILIGLVRDEGRVRSFILDGHYRLVKALWLHQTRLPAIALSPEETAACER